MDKIDSPITSEGSNYTEDKEQSQKLHYEYLSRLQTMSQELPSIYQQRLPYDLLSGLASVLLDGSVFNIVSGLQEVQQLEEKNLSSARLKRERDYRAGKADLLRKHCEKLKSITDKPHNTPVLQNQCSQELQEFEKRWEEERKRGDMRIVLDLDQKVMDQQSMLEKAGVPGFFVTNKPSDIRLQMYLLEFILRLKAECKLT